MKPENIPTPETDNEIEENRGDIPKYGWVSPEKSRELEQRLTVAREALEVVIRRGSSVQQSDQYMREVLVAASQALTYTAPNQ